MHVVSLHRHIDRSSHPHHRSSPCLVLLNYLFRTAFVTRPFIAALQWGKESFQYCKTSKNKPIILTTKTVSIDVSIFYFSFTLAAELSSSGTLLLKLDFDSASYITFIPTCEINNNNKNNTTRPHYSAALILWLIVFLNNIYCSLQCNTSL